MNPLLEKLHAMTRPHHAHETELAKIRKRIMNLEEIVAHLQSDKIAADKVVADLSAANETIAARDKAIVDLQAQITELHLQVATLLVAPPPVDLTPLEAATVALDATLNPAPVPQG